MQMLQVATIGSCVVINRVVKFDVAPGHMACVVQDWLQVNCPGFIEKINGLGC